MGARLSETELQKSLDFCVNLFNPTSPEQHNRIANVGKIGKELLDVTAPVMDPRFLETVLMVEKEPRTMPWGANVTRTDDCVEPQEWSRIGKRIATCFNSIVRGVKGTATGWGATKSCSGRLRADSDSSGDETNSDCEKAAETKMVLHKINARRVVHSEYGINNFESEPLDGFVVRLEKGRLGLVRVQ